VVGDGREGAAGVHPGPATVALSRPIIEQLIEHARNEYPNEACGLIIGDRSAAEDGRPVRFVPTRNAAASPYRYEIDSKDLLRLTMETDEVDEVFWAIVHSHVKSEARPSPTDIGLAFYPDALYIVVSLAADGAHNGGSAAATAASMVRAWRIVEGQVYEVPIEMTDA
jgi:[CysO sulfur-carrier protein]-S-L-cysteine hydrolase